MLGSAPSDAVLPALTTGNRLASDATWRSDAPGSAAGAKDVTAGKEERKMSGGGVINRLKTQWILGKEGSVSGPCTASPVTEQELLSLNELRPEHVLGLKDNIYGIDFTRFKIWDLDTSSILFDISKPCTEQEDDDDDGGQLNVSAGRFVRYQFTPAFLWLRRVGATVEFAIGEKPLKSFRMIERHFF
uniref:GMP phosphodiesterase delta subunit domain-containing protein n=1 Tax=Leptobrachium leishanense TaxID=445787 RepID=A0A8C5MB08_9ANUR